MIKPLQFVRGAVATKDLVPVLTHFRICGGRIQGTNGRISIDHPCPQMAELDITVPAQRFLKAVDACQSQPTLEITDGGKLTVRRGKFRALLPLGENSAFPLHVPDTGQELDPSQILPAFRRLSPFIGIDASRPWACGVLLRDGFAYATNNVVICRTPCGWGGDESDVVIPSFAVEELLRLGDTPTSLVLGETSATFRYLGDAWLRTQLISDSWPDITKFFSARTKKPIPAGLRDAVETVLPFCNDPKFPVIRFSADGVATVDGEMMAAIELEQLEDGLYRAEPLLAVLAVATHADFAQYPNPIPWWGDQLEGVFVGVKR